MRLLFAMIILAFTIYGCNSNQENGKQSTEISIDKCFAYPSTIDSLHINDLYDSARWYVYALYCDENYLPKSDTAKSISFGELPLKFDNITVKSDTVELNFIFLDNQQSILPSMTRNNKDLSTGVAFNMNTKGKMYMLSSNGYSTVVSGGNNRFENSLQPAVLTYIKNNWSKLDNCFKELASHKGISFADESPVK
jgi:hypothetical protein